jgi:hypothetical protein
VEPVSSVIAFVARYAERPTDDAVAAEILSALDADGRLVIAAQAVPRGERRAWLRQRSGRDWSEAWLLHVEQQAFVAVRRELQRRGLLRA